MLIVGQSREKVLEKNLIVDFWILRLERKIVAVIWVKLDWFFHYYQDFKATTLKHFLKTLFMFAIGICLV